LAASEFAYCQPEGKTAIQMEQRKTGIYNMLQRQGQSWNGGECGRRQNSVPIWPDGGEDSCLGRRKDRPVL